jgi:Family of unknown function (DUF6459)
MRALDTPPVPGPRLVAVPDAAPAYDYLTVGAQAGADWPPDGVMAGQLTLDELLAAQAAEGRRAEAAAAAAWPTQIAQAIVETLAGTRPLRQIFPWTTEGTQARIKRLSARYGTDTRPRIQRVLTSRPSARAMELTVIAGFGTRTRALAMRFEHVPARQGAPGRPGRQARWLCTDLETA